MSESKHTPGPWEYVPSTEHHGPYVTSEFGTTVADCYVMSNPAAPSALNGGDSRPIHHLHEMADPNARLIAAAPDLLEALKTLQAYAIAHIQHGGAHHDSVWSHVADAIQKAEEPQ